MVQHGASKKFSNLKIQKLAKYGHWKRRSKGLVMAETCRTIFYCRLFVTKQPFVNQNIRNNHLRTLAESYIRNTTPR